MENAQGGISAGSSEGWHEIGAASEPAFNNSWTNYGGTFPTAAFRKDADGVVHIKGFIKSGTIGFGLPVFTLPVGYRPTSDYLVFPTATNPNAYGQANVHANGDVVAQVGSNTWFSLSTISFYAGA